MGAQLQNIFQQDGAAWTVKYYKEKTLKALVADLSRRDEEGIPLEVCNKVKQALNVAITLVEPIRDGGFFFNHFHENLSEFRDVYVEWNGGKNSQERSKVYGRLLKHKGAMFAKFFKEMDRLKKNKEYEERIRQFELFTSVDKELMDDLNKTFAELVDGHGDTIFISLKKTLTDFSNRQN